MYEHQILKDLKENPGNEILYHHRRPTSTKNLENAAHPLCSFDNFKKHKYYLVHNGNIQNSDELWRKHTDDGLKYHSVCEEKENGPPIFNDSESLMLELALIIEGKKEKKDFDAYGSMAFIMIQTDNNGKPLNMYFGRNEGSPLKVLSDKEKIVIASDMEGNDVKPNVLNRISYVEKTISEESMLFPRYWGSKQHTQWERSPIMIPPGDNHRMYESPENRELIMNGGSILDKIVNSDDDIENLEYKSDDELEQLQQELMTDVACMEHCLKTENDLKERSRLVIENKEIKDALKRVDAEIDKRILATC